MKKSQQLYYFLETERGSREMEGNRDGKRKGRGRKRRKMEGRREKGDRERNRLEEAQQLFNFLADRMFLKNSPREDKVL